ELKFAELTGAVDVLRGKEPPPPAKFPMISAWRPDTIYHEGAIVAFAGSTWQAQRDTARVPGTQDWVCLATRGNSLTVRSTYDDDVEYRCLDVTMTNGSTSLRWLTTLALAPARARSSWPRAAHAATGGRTASAASLDPEGS